MGQRVLFPGWRDCSRGSPKTTGPPGAAIRICWAANSTFRALSSLVGWLTGQQLPCLYQSCFWNWLPRSFCFLVNLGPMWNSWGGSFSLKRPSGCSSLFHLGPTGLLRSLGLSWSSLSRPFRETSAFELFVFNRRKDQAHKATRTSNSSYNTTFWWLKCKRSRNIWIPFPINHTRSFKKKKKSRENVPSTMYSVCSKPKHLKNTWRLMNPKYLPLTVFNIEEKSPWFRATA